MHNAFKEFIRLVLAAVIAGVALYFIESYLERRMQKKGTGK
tara:strand:- start:386 stop:508 length:123 start_codon:yes stop_codon:yes gene_type:complete